ncbi:GNAT family N-acetyltransferase [Cupriavidus basilensis]
MIFAGTSVGVLVQGQQAEALAARYQLKQETSTLLGTATKGFARALPAAQQPLPGLGTVSIVARESAALPGKTLLICELVSHQDAQALKAYERSRASRARPRAKPGDIVNMPDRQTSLAGAAGHEPVVLDTARSRLRQWREADFAPLPRSTADPVVMACFPAPLDRAASDAIALRCQSLIAARGWGFWAVERKEDGAFIGFVGLHEPAATLPFSPWRGNRLAPVAGALGAGLCRGGGAAALQFGFGRLALAEIVSFTALANVRSRAVMERLGMVADGTFEHPALAQDSPLLLHWLYRMSAQRWQSLSGNVRAP